MLDVVSTVIVSNLSSCPVNGLNTEQLTLRHLCNLHGQSHIFACSSTHLHSMLVHCKPGHHCCLLLKMKLTQSARASCCTSSCCCVCGQVLWARHTHCWDVWVPPVVQGLLLLPWLLADVNYDQGCWGPGRHADRCPAARATSGSNWVTACTGVLSRATVSNLHADWKRKQANGYSVAHDLQVAWVCRVC
jgi:hypothetical protein